MNVIYKITKRNLWQHKTRTLLGMIGIIVAIAAFTGVTTLGTSTQNMILQQEKKLYMDWNIGIRNMTKEEQQAFEQLDGLKELDYYKSYGYAKVFDQTVGMPYLYLEGVQERELQELKLRLISGRMPENDSEIVLSSSLLQNMDEPYEIGDTIVLNIGDRVKTERQDAWEKQMGIGNMEVYGDYFEGRFEQSWSDYFEGETLTNQKKMTYEIVGVISEYNVTDRRVYAPLGYDAFTKWTPKQNNAWEKGISIRAKFKNKQAFLKIKDLWEEKELGKQLQTRIFLNGSLNTIQYQDRVWDWLLYRDKTMYYYNVSDGYVNDLKIVDLLKTPLYLVIMVSTVLFIYNIFAISLAERRKYLGIIASIGATERQKRSSLYFECFILLLIGVPIGIASGVFGIQIVANVMNEWVQNIFDVSVPFQAVISWNGIVAILILAIVTIYSSAWLTMKKAGKITAIEAIKGVKEYKIKKRTTKKGNIIGTIFGIEGKLAVKNGVRNRGTKTIIFSMVLTLSLFVGIATYMKYMQVNMGEDGSKEYDLFTYSLDIEQGNQVLPKIRTMDSIQTVVQVISQKGYVEQLPIEQRYITLVSFDEQYEADYWKRVTGQEITHIQWKKGESIPAIVLPTDDIRLDSRAYRDWNIGKTYEAELINRAEKNKKDRMEAISPIAISHIAPMGWKTLKSGDILKQSVVANENVMIIPRFIANQITKPNKEGEHGEWYNTLFLSSNGDVQQAKQDLSNLSWSAVNTNVKAISDTDSSQYLKKISSVLFTGYIVLVTSICVLNIINLVNNTMDVRRREMAMLSSIGMTPESITKMLWIESMWYSGKAILFSIPIIILVEIFAYVMYIRDGRGVINGVVAPILIPWGSIVLGCFGLIIVSMIGFLYSYSKMKQDHVMEKLKTE